MSAKIEFYGNNNQVMNDAIDRIIISLYTKKQKEDLKTILMTGCGSKSGTTTIAIDLAVGLAASGFKTLLVDCDLRKGTKFKRLNQYTTKGLSDYLSGDITLEELVCETNYKLLDYIPSGSISQSPVRLLCSKQMEFFEKEVKVEYDFIIFDFPSINIVSDAEILFPYIDGIAYIAALAQTTKRQLKDARSKVAKYHDKYLGLIINRVNADEYEKYIKDFDYFGEKNLVTQYRANIRNKKFTTKSTGKEKANEKKS